MPFLPFPLELLNSINDKHIAKALWAATRPSCPPARNAYIIYIRITINVVSPPKKRRRKEEAEEEENIAKEKKEKQKQTIDKYYRKASKS